MQKKKKKSGWGFYFDFIVLLKWVNLSSFFFYAKIYDPQFSPLVTFFPFYCQREQSVAAGICGSTGGNRAGWWHTLGLGGCKTSNTELYCRMTQADALLYAFWSKLTCEPSSQLINVPHAHPPCFFHKVKATLYELLSQCHISPWCSYVNKWCMV